MEQIIIGFFILGTTLTIFYFCRWVLSFIRARKNGKATLFEVRAWLLKGDKEKAISLYCQIFRTDRSQARQAVEELDRSLLKKKP